MWLTAGGECARDADCDDGQVCTYDICVEGECLGCAYPQVPVDLDPPVMQDLDVGQIVDFDLIASRYPEPPYRGVNEIWVALAWDPAVLELVGSSEVDDLCPGNPVCGQAFDWPVAGFSTEPVNDYWSDGTAQYLLSRRAGLPDGLPVFVDGRLWLGRLHFRVLSIPAADSLIRIEEKVPNCCFLEPGDGVHSLFCPEPTETCCVNLIDVQDCAAGGGAILPTWSSVQWNGCEDSGDLGYATIYTTSSCTTSYDCGDRDSDGKRDDRCLWYECVGGKCVATPRADGDMGGAFGACAADGVADGNDRFAALNCFADEDPLDPTAPFPCALDPPFTLNVDTAGPLGSCYPDGVCDGNDAFGAINAFAGTRSCRCALELPRPSMDDCALGAPAPDAPAEGGQHVTLSLDLSRRTAAAGGTFEIDALLDTPLSGLRGYQLHLSISGGTSGTLDVIDIAVHPRKDRALPGSGWQAFNVNTRQLIVGQDSPGIAVEGGAYLATFVLRATDDAAGRFLVELLADASDPALRTFLFGKRGDGGIKVGASDGVPVTVEAGP